MPMEPTPPRGPTPSSQIEEKCDPGDPAEPYTHHHQAWAERTGRARKREGDGSRLPARFDCSRYLMSGHVPGEREGSGAPTSPDRPQSGRPWACSSSVCGGAMVCQVLAG